MKKTLLGLIVALTATMLLTACCSNDSSCPVTTADFTVDSFIDTDYSIETPVLSKEISSSSNKGSSEKQPPALTMSHLKIIISIVVAFGVSGVLDLLFGWYNIGGRLISRTRRLCIEWISSFVFLLLTDIILIFWGEPLMWIDIVINILVCTAGTIIEILFHLIKRKMIFSSKNNKKLNLK